jgi:AraC family ethanolamine operon transcriptional activator
MEIMPINGPEDLREATRGADVEIVQLKPAKLHGSITHIDIGNLTMSAGRFSSDTRMRGLLHRERVVLATLLDSAGRVTHWWREVRPGDVGVHPAGADFDAIHCGGASYLVVSIALREFLSMLAGEDRLADPAFWNTKGVHQIDSNVGNDMLRQLRAILSDVERKTTAPSAQASDFFKRSIIEAFVASLMRSLPPDGGRPQYTGARLVSEVEDYIDVAGGRPVHISELCRAMRVSRRSLHRAFAEALGIGPVAYLRRRRLSAIRSVLRRSDPATISIPDIAFDYGFPEPGRFSAFYRSHFGESPSETLHSRHAGIHKKR